MAIANFTLRFLTELMGIAAIGYAGFQIAAPMPLRAVAGIAAVIALVVTWSMIVAPNTVNGLAQSEKDLIGTGILLLAAVALGAAGQLRLAIAFALVVLANTALLFLLGQGTRGNWMGMVR